MKKFLLVLSLLFLLSACSTQKTPDLSFEQSYALFVKNIFGPTILALGDTMSHPQIIEKAQIAIQGENTDANVDFKLDSLSLENTQKAESSSNFVFSLDMLDKVKQSSTYISGDIDILLANQEMFVRGNKLYVEMGGSAEASLINLIIENFLSKRIKIDNTEAANLQQIEKNSIMQTYRLPYVLQNVLQKNKIFVEEKKTDYEGKPAYQISLNNDLDLLTNLFSGTMLSIEGYEDLLSGTTLDGYLLATAKDSVELIIQEMTFQSYPDLKITGKIGKGFGELLVDNKLMGNGYRFSRSPKRKSTYIQYQQISEMGYSPIAVNVDITPTVTQSGIELQMDGDVELALSQLGLPGTLILEGGGKYSVTQTGGFDIEGPSGYLLLSDLIGSQYTLPAASD